MVTHFFQQKILKITTAKPVYNEQIGQKRSLKSIFRYNRSIFKQIYAIGENNVLSYNQKFAITDFVIIGFNCIIT